MSPLINSEEDRKLLEAVTKEPGIRMFELRERLNVTNSALRSRLGRLVVDKRVRIDTEIRGVSRVFPVQETNKNADTDGPCK